MSETARLKQEAEANRRKRIVHLHGQDYSTSDIAELLGRSNEYVLKVLRENGLMPARRTPKQKPLKTVIARIRSRGAA